MSNLRWKLLLTIAVAVIFGAVGVYPIIAARYGIAGPTILTDRMLKLGLDLKGGVHLVLRVQTDDALRIESETEISGDHGLLEEADAIVDVQLPPVGGFPVCHTQNRFRPVGDDNPVTVVEVAVDPAEQPALGELLDGQDGRRPRVEEHDGGDRDLRWPQTHERGAQRQHQTVRPDERRRARTTRDR